MTARAGRQDAALDRLRDLVGCGTHRRHPGPPELLAYFLGTYADRDGDWDLYYSDREGSYLAMAADAVRCGAPTAGPLRVAFNRAVLAGLAPDTAPGAAPCGAPTPGVAS